MGMARSHDPVGQSGHRELLRSHPSLLIQRVRLLPPGPDRARAAAWGGGTFPDQSYGCLEGFCAEMKGGCCAVRQTTRSPPVGSRRINRRVRGSPAQDRGRHVHRQVGVEVDPVLTLREVREPVSTSTASSNRQPPVMGTTGR